jgi:hypothetical protein
MNWEKDFEEEFPDDKELIRNVEERGALRERERIIALIEGIGLGCLECSDWQLMNAVELIKKENK